MKKYILCIFFLSVLNHPALAQSLRISPEQLQQSLGDQDLIILDTRSEADYLAGHIDKALSFPIKLTYKNDRINGKIISPANIQKYFRARGIHRDSRIVVYDNGDIIDAARLFWVLEVYNLQHVQILDHGYDHWLRKAYPISLEVNTATSKSHYIASLNYQRLASKFTTQLATRNSNQLIIDARNFSDYSGRTSTARRFGHIPSAIHIPAAHNLMLSKGITSLKPLNELKKLYQNISKDKKIVIYCAIGRVSSTNYLALRELGYDVSNYDASWNEWGNDDKLPIEK